MAPQHQCDYQRKKICASAAKGMLRVFLYHLRVSALLFGLKSVVSPVGGLFLAFVVSCNMICMMERVWDLQLRSMIYWPAVCQCVFMVSRLMLCCVAVGVAGFWLAFGWFVFMRCPWVC